MAYCNRRTYKVPIDRRMVDCNRVLAYHKRLQACRDPVTIFPAYTQLTYVTNGQSVLGGKVSVKLNLT